MEKSTSQHETTDPTAVDQLRDRASVALVQTLSLLQEIKVTTANLSPEQMSEYARQVVNARPFFLLQVVATLNGVRKRLAEILAADDLRRQGHNVGAEGPTVN